MSSSTISPNALSLFFPDEQTTPTTVDQILTLPPCLESISPALASLHLARVRLLLSIPSSTMDQTSWCRTCGELRGVRDIAPTVSASTSTPPPLSATASTKTDAEGPGPNRRQKQKARKIYNKKRKSPLAKECSKCGTSFKRPVPDVETRRTPSARKARMQRLKDQMRERDELTASTSAISLGEALAAESLTSSPMLIDSSSTSTTAGIMPLPPTTDTSSQPTSPPPKYVNTQAISHVHTSSPNLPTYPQPPAKHAPLPVQEKGKRRKKSGLAKLLAENKEREMGGSSAGVRGGWGLE